MELRLETLPRTSMEKCRRSTIWGISPANTISMVTSRRSVVNAVRSGSAERSVSSRDLWWGRTSRRHEVGELWEWRTLLFFAALVQQVKHTWVRLVHPTPLPHCTPVTHCPLTQLEKKTTNQDKVLQSHIIGHTCRL